MITKTNSVNLSGNNLVLYRNDVILPKNLKFKPYAQRDYTEIETDMF